MRGYRFSGFEIDLQERELRRNGRRVPLQPQPFQLLCELLDASGRIVPRETIIRSLWGETNLANPDQSLNIAVRKLRDALDDAADEPRFIQTVARQGYRFVGAFERVDPEKPAADPDLVPVEIATAASARPRNRILPAVIALALAMAAGGWFWWNQTQRWDLKSKDLVLVAKFTDTTGEAALEGAFETLLEVEFANSGRVTPVSQERIGDTLRLMRRPHDARPGLPDAIEVCRRDPAIRAVVGGDVRRLGAKYVLSIRLLNPVSGTVMAGFTSEAAERTGLVEALRALSSSVQDRLGGEQSQHRDVLDRVTTASLQALKLYSDGHAMGRQWNWPAAEVMFREAVKLDPGFASAHLFLAWAIYNQDPNAPGRFMPPAERALALADTVSEEEALFIRGSYHSFKGDDAGSIPVYEALLRRYPQHHWVVGNISRAYDRTRQREKLRALIRQLPALRPNDPNSYLRGIDDCFCSPGEDPNRAVTLAAKAAELARGSGAQSVRVNALVEQHFSNALLHWLDGDARLTQGELDGAVKLALESSDVRGRGALVLKAAAGFLSLGRFRRSAELIQSISPDLTPSVRFRWEIWSPIYAHDEPGISSLTSAQQSTAPHPLNVIGLLRGGRPDAAARMFARIDANSPNTTRDAILAARGELALQQGRHEQSAGMLRSAMANMSSRFPEYLLSAQSLARISGTQGRTDEAIAILKGATETSPACGGFLRAAFWPHLRFDLMTMYQKAGRHREADTVRAELTKLLATADDNFVLKVKLKAAQP